MTYGECIKAEREKQGLSHREVARLAGIAPTTLYYIETGQTQDPRISQLAALYMALGVHWPLPRGVDEVPQPLSVRGRRVHVLDKNALK